MFKLGYTDGIQNHFVATVKLFFIIGPDFSVELKIHRLKKIVINKIICHQTMTSFLYAADLKKVILLLPSCTVDVNKIWQ